MEIQLDLMISQLDFLFLGLMPGSLGEHMMFDSYENCFNRAHPVLKRIDSATGKAPLIENMIYLTRDFIPAFVRESKETIENWSLHCGYSGASAEDRLVVKMSILNIDFIEEEYFPIRTYMGLGWEMPVRE